MSFNEPWHGLVFLGLGIIFVVGYLAWNILIKKKRIKRMADIVEASKWDPEAMRAVSEQTIPAFITLNSSLAGLTFASLMIIIAFIILDRQVFSGQRDIILNVALGMSAIATVCYLFSLEQLTKILPPARDPDRLIRFYKYSISLWLLGMILIVATILLFLLLVNTYLMMGVGLFVLIVIIRYFKINNDW